MSLNDTIFSLENWICPIQYGILAEDTATEGGNSEAAATENDASSTPSQEGGDPASTEAAQAEGSEQEKPPKKAWYTERIDKLTYQKSELETKAQTLAQQNAQLRQYLETLLGAGASPSQAAAATTTVAEGMAEAGNAGAGRTATGDPRGRVYNQAEIEAMIEAKVNERVQQQTASQADQEFNNRCNAVAAAGNQQFGAGFQNVVQQLNAAGVMDRPFLEAITQFDDAPILLHHLGQDGNVAEAMRIRNLAPVAMATALAKLSTQLAAQQAAGKAPRVSNAPPPVTRVGGSGAPPADTLEGLAEKGDMDAWMALREKQLSDKRAH